MHRNDLENIVGLLHVIVAIGAVLCVFGLMYVGLVKLSKLIGGLF